MARARRRRRKTKTRRAARIVRRTPAGKTHAQRKPAARPTQRRASTRAAPRQPQARRIRIVLPPPTRAETLLLEANNASTDAYSQALASAATLALSAGTLGTAPE